MIESSTSSLLQVIAQLAVALVGFSALVGALGRGDHSLNSLHTVRVRGIVLSGLMAMSFSLLPFVLAGFGLSGAQLWRVLSALYVAAAVPLAASQIRSNKEATANSDFDEPVHYLVSLVVGTAALIAQLLNALGIFGGVELAVYQAVLILALIDAGHVFWVCFRVMRKLGDAHSVPEAAPHVVDPQPEKVAPTSEDQGS